MKIRRLILNPFQENTYILFSENKECAIIDPGCSTKEEQDKLSDLITENSLKPKYLINTHCHFDHALGNAFVSRSYGLGLWANPEDEFLLEALLESAAAYKIPAEKSPKISQHLSEDTVLKLGNEEIHFIHLPGHSPGSMGVYVLHEGFIIAGDVLFKGSIGRTDLPKGDYDVLMNSICQKMFELDVETEVFPGHGYSTTIGVELKTNPFLSCSNK